MPQDSQSIPSITEETEDIHTGGNNPQPIRVPQTLKDSIDKNQMPAKAKPQQASITADAYRQLFAELPHTVAGNALRFIMVTGRRKNEVVEMARQEIRRDVWIISGNCSKNGKPQEVPLVGSVRDVLGLSPTDAGKCWPVGATTLNAVLARLGVMASYTEELLNSQRRTING